MALALATVYVVARLVVAAKGDTSIFIVVGTLYHGGSGLPPHITVVHGSGYDGQFYFRMALDPARLSRAAYGIRFDTISRLERMGYPAIAWLLAGGRHSLIPDTLIITNVLALGGLAIGGGYMARSSGRHALWGLAIAGYWGYLWSAGRDLTEITAAAFLVGGLYATRRHRWLLAGVLLLAAVLSKETATYVVAIIACTRIVSRLRPNERSDPWASEVAWLLPLTGSAVWQLVVHAATGTFPLLGSGQHNISTPFLGLFDALRTNFDDFAHVPTLLWLGELGVLVLLSVLAGLAWRSTTAPMHERLAWIAVVVLAICAAPGIWAGKVGFRSLDDVYLFSWLLLLGTSWKLRWPAIISAATWLVMAVELIKFV